MNKKCEKCGQETYNIKYCYKCMGTKERYEKKTKIWREDE